MSPGRTSPAHRRTARLLFLAAGLLVLAPSRGEIGLRLRAPASDRTGFLSREWIRQNGAGFSGARELLTSRMTATPPAATDLAALAERLGQPASLCAGFLPEGRPAWSLGGDAPRQPENLADGVFRLEWQPASHSSVLLWVPPRAAAPSPLGWHAVELDLVRLLQSSVPSNHLAGTESLVAWRPDTLEPLAGASATGGKTWLISPDHPRRRGGLKLLMEQMTRQDRGVHTFARFSPDESRLVLARVEWFPLTLAGLPLLCTLDTEQPFVGRLRDTTGAWRRMEPGSREAFDLLEDGTGWILRGRDGWEGVRMEGRALEGVYSAARFEVGSGLRGLNSFSARLQPDGVLVADVYQVLNRSMHHFVYRFQRTGPFVSDPDNELPLKTQVR